MVPVSPVLNVMSPLVVAVVSWNSDAAVFRETWRARPAAGEVWDRCQIRCLLAWNHDVRTRS